MSSQFDDLLGDFGDSNSGTATIKTGGDSNGAEDSGLLVDFSAEAEVTNGQANGVDHEMDSSSSANPLYDLTANDSQAESSNPLYDFSIDTNTSSNTGNPLYDFTTEEETTDEPQQQTSGQGDLFDLVMDTNTNTTPGSNSANPLYDFDASVPADEGQRNEQEVDLLSGTNQAETTGQSDQYADLLGDFSSGQPEASHPVEPEPEPTDFTTQEYSSSDVNGGGALLDLGPTESTTDQTETIVTTTYQDENPPLETEETQQEIQQETEPEPLQETQQETEPEPQQETEPEPQQEIEPEPQQETEQEPQQEPEQEPQPGPQGTFDDEEAELPPREVTEGAEALPDLVVMEEGDEELKSEVTPSLEDQPQVEQQEAEYEKEDKAEAVVEEQEETREPQPVQEQEQGEVPDSTGNEGAYHADRREEDLEQYCLHREEETSEVSDGIGEAAAPEERDQTEVEEAQRQDQTEMEQAQRPESDLTETTEDVQQQYEDQTEEAQGVPEDQFADDQEAVPSQTNVPEVEPEEAIQVEAAEPQQEGSGRSETSRASFTSSSSIVLLASPTSPPANEPFGGRVTEISMASAPPPAVAVFEEEILQDGHTLAKTTHTENRYSTGSGFDNSQANQDFTSHSAKEDNFQTQNEPAMNRQTAAPQAAPRVQQPATLYDDDDDEEEEGVYENEPERRDDVLRESDQKDETNLPASGTTQNLLAKFKANQVESSTPRAKREITPPNPTQGGGEYVSEPRMQWEQYEGKAESGVFESQPMVEEGVVKSGTLQDEPLPEQGSTRSLTAKFKQLESEKKIVTSSGKREITPDRSARVEYVSEPSGFIEHYEGKAESGVFESEPALNPDVIRHGEGQVEEMPERGTTRNLADRFKQFSAESAAPMPSRGKREITPDTSGRVEYVSEPSGGIEVYENKTESGVFENQPQTEADVVNAATAVEEFVPERGYTKNVAARFKELESNAKSPPMSPVRQKEFTPPRDEGASHQSGVSESTPQVNAEVVTSSELPEEILPERGTAKNIAQRFRQLEAESKSPPSTKPKKELTPPPRDSGVYENQPDRFEADYNRPAESGIIESQPITREDLSRESETPKFTEELPERGTARNLLSRWKQMESESTKSPSPGARQKEFTPPREEPRIAQQSKSPRTPKSPSANTSMDNGSVHPSELPGQYQPQNEPHVIESTPEEQRSDVIRAADTDWNEGMPKKNTAKKMLARFQNIQAEADKHAPRPESRKESESENNSCTEPTSTTSTTPSPTSTTPSTTSTDEGEAAAMQSARLKFEDPDKVGRSKSMRAAIQVEKCGACDKTVYAMERLEMNKRVYHRACFRCSQCKSVLTPKTFAINNDVIFCTTHYKQLFTRKGNYDEGFGRTQHKTRWNSNPNLAEAGKEGASESRSQTEVKS